MATCEPYSCFRLETMANSLKVLTLELSQPLQDQTDLGEYEYAQVLVQWYGRPLGWIWIPIRHSRCTAQDQGQAILENHSWILIRQLLIRGLEMDPPVTHFRVADLLALEPSKPVDQDPKPLVSVVVVVRNHPDQGVQDPERLRHCFNALAALRYDSVERIVVDNAPLDNQTKALMATHFPTFQYLQEPTPGLNQARNTGITAATGELIAFTDDDCEVDPEWVTAILRVFQQDPDVMAETGLAVPRSLETPAQLGFEQQGGWAHGFERHWIRWGAQSDPRQLIHIRQFMTDCTMAFRRSVFEQIGLFDAALDQRSDVLHGGGSMDLMFRLIYGGYTLAYAPEVWVYHHHPADELTWQHQIQDHYEGLMAYLMKSLRIYPDYRRAVLRVLIWHIRGSVGAWIRSTGGWRAIAAAEIRGSVQGIQAALNVKTDGSLPELSSPAQRATEWTGSVRMIDLSEPMQDWEDVKAFNLVRVYVTYQDQLIGYVDMQNEHQSIQRGTLQEAIVSQLGYQLLPLVDPLSESPWQDACADLRVALSPPVVTDPESAEEMVEAVQIGSISIVIPTYDRPEDLRVCLQHVTAQVTSRSIEVLVCDNHPESGLTPPVVAEFEQVRLIQECRKGASYARNAGIAASRGEVVVMIDDDVTVPPDWLERLVDPFQRPEVMVVTGNVLPRELQTEAQWLFERIHGGLSQGFQPLEVNGHWLHSFRRASPPTWSLGVSANAAFRATVFSHPEIGLMPEVLSAGLPSSGGEENYLVYKILKAGFTLVYEPSVYGWHRHRHTREALEQQMFGYSKSSVAYHLTLWRDAQDPRGLWQLFVQQPRYYVQRILAKLQGSQAVPWRFLWLDIAGYVAGFWAYQQTLQIVAAQGSSDPYVPVAEREGEFRVS